MKAAAPFGVLAAVLLGCDPCAGVASCVSTPRLAIEGTIVEHLSGLPQPGVRVDVVRVGGAPLEADSVSATTDASGHWQVSIPARSADSVTVDINVTSSFANYRVRSVALSTSDRRGVETVLPPWVVDPYFPYALELHYAGFGDNRIGGAEFQFHRTGGVEFSTDEGGSVFSAATEPSGRAPLFALHAHARSLGDLIGDLVIDLPAPLPPDTVRGVRLAATQLLQAPVGIVVLRLGPSLAYVGEFHARSTGKPAAGVQVTFRRTGGIATVPESFSASTDAGGRFAFAIRPLAAAGTVTGDLDVAPPPPASPFTLRGLQLPAFRGDSTPLLGVWNEGVYLPWKALIKIGGRGVAGIDVDFHRTGGIAVTPSDFTVRSDGSGYALFTPTPLDTGFVEADVVVHSPPPLATFRTPIRLHTVEDDVTGGLMAIWDLDAPPPANRASSVQRRPPDP